MADADEKRQQQGVQDPEQPEVAGKSLDPAGAFSDSAAEQADVQHEDVRAGAAEVAEPQGPAGAGGNEAGTGGTAADGTAADGGRGGEAASAAGDEVARLRAELDEARDEARRNLEGWARSQAELENYRRRAAREREESVQYELRKLLESFLPVMDNLERALAVPEGEGGDGLRKGVEMTMRQFREVLSRAGVEAVEVKPGDAFDPNLHEAVLLEEGDSEEPVVVQVLQTGYRMGERLVRPAMVKVARKGA